MFDIPIIDSLTHPTIDGDWILPKYPQKSDIDKLISDMDQYHISHALAVGMKGVGSYDEGKYIDCVSPYMHRLVPIAFFDLRDDFTLTDVKDRLGRIKKLGYSGIKLSPRISGFRLENPLLSPIIREANELKLSVLLCSYFYGHLNDPCRSIDDLAKLISGLNGANLVLLHAGTVRLLEVVELARANDNILLDLSFTLCKYAGSSIDLDIQFTFNSFDQRICIGSDHPEFSPSELRERYEFFAKGIEQEKAKNIAYKNIAKFLGLRVML